jgi:aminocarboxymuconate-semialdehyde decarboxylase
MDVDRRLAAMDDLGIDLQVLSPNPLTFLHHVAAEFASGFARVQNDALAAVVACHPDRLAGLAQLPMQDPVAAVDELHRAVGELGLVGAYVGTDLGLPLDDPALDLFYAACVRLDIPVFLHPAPGGIDAPRRDSRMARFDGDLWLWFAHEEALAVATLVLGGVLRRHEGLDVCIAHGGGSTSWLAERMRHAAMTRPWASRELSGTDAVDAELRRIWWDSHVGGPRALAALMAAFGVDRVVGGTNLAGWDETTDPSWGDAGLAATLDANARRLIRLAP